MRFQHIFKEDKIAIGMVHLLPLPGTPLYDEEGGMDKIIDQAYKDVDNLQKSGFDAILFCNEWDMPYEYPVSHAVVASYSSIVSSLKEIIKIPFGINVLLDAEAAVSISAAVGAQFIRCFLGNAYVGDMGMFLPKPAPVLRLRRNLHINENLSILANVTAGFADSMVNRNLSEIIKGTIFIDLADGVVVSGKAAGEKANIDDLKKASQSCGDKPLIVGTGVIEQNLEDMFKYAFGVIVGTAIKKEQKTLNPIDIDRAKAFMEKVVLLRRN